MSFQPLMEVYKNISGRSGITQYEIKGDKIYIKFKGKDSIYIYSNLKCGKQHIEKMKSLAIKGKGLGSYISQNPAVRNNYEKK